MGVRRMTSEERQRASTEAKLIVECATGAAANAGVLPGDVIVGINSRRINSEQELRDAIRGGTGTVALLIEREDAQIFVPVPLD